MPRCFSISIQSEVACREALRAFTEPAIWIAPENSSSFSVSVVLPASGWEMMAKVRRRRTWGVRSDMGVQPGTTGLPGENRDYRWRAGWHTELARRSRLPCEITPIPFTTAEPMPELPDITVYVERLDAKIRGDVLKRVRVMNPFLVRTAV